MNRRAVLGRALAAGAALPLAGSVLTTLAQRIDPARIRFAADAILRAGLRLERDGGPDWYWRVMTQTGNTLGWLGRDGTFRSVWEWGAHR